MRIDQSRNQGVVDEIELFSCRITLLRVFSGQYRRDAPLVHSNTVIFENALGADGRNDPAGMNEQIYLQWGLLLHSFLTLAADEFGGGL